MNITTKHMTNNDCYKAGKKITVKGIMVHSTATPGIMAADWFSRWNKPGTSACVHAFLDDKVVMQYLPWDHRGWHAGGAANNTHVSFEICEPKDLNDKEYFNKAYNNAVDLCVYLCKMFKLTEKDILDHSEGFKRGIATNHGDVMHWFPKHGKNMNTFREDVRKRLEEKELKKIVTYFGDADLFAAVLVSQKNQCPLMRKSDFDASGLKADQEIPIGGKPGTTRYDSFRDAAKLV